MNKKFISYLLLVYLSVSYCQNCAEKATFTEEDTDPHICLNLEVSLEEYTCIYD